MPQQPGYRIPGHASSEHMRAALHCSENGQLSFFPCVRERGPARHAPSQAAGERWVPPLALLGSMVWRRRRRVAAVATGLETLT